MHGSLGTPPGHSGAIVKGQGVGVGLGLGLGLGDGEGEGAGDAPQGNVSMVWQENGSTSNGATEHSKSPKFVVKQADAGLLQIAVPTLVCGGQLTQVLSTDCVNLLQLVPSQQV